jgi:hypothetical protein
MNPEFRYIARHGITLRTTLRKPPRSTARQWSNTIAPNLVICKHADIRHCHPVILPGPERQLSVQPHTDLDKVWLVLWSDYPMSDKEVNPDSSRVRLKLFA